MKQNYKTIEIIEMHNALEHFIEKDILLPISLAWIIDDNYEELKKIVIKFEKHREKKIKPLNDKNAFEMSENNKIIVKEKYLDEFKKISEEINSLLNIDNEIEIKIAKRSDIPTVISNKDLRAIKFMIE